MKFIRKFFKNIIPSTEEKIGGHDLDDKVEKVSEEAVIDSTGPSKVAPVAKKKPGRPKGSINKKTATTKKTPSKKTPSKKTPPKEA